MCITNKESFICGDKFSGFGKIVSNTKFLLISTLGVNLTRFQQKLNQVELLLVSTNNSIGIYHQRKKNENNENNGC